MNINELRNKAREGIEPERPSNSLLLPQKTFFGVDFGVKYSCKFYIAKNRDATRHYKPYSISYEIDWNQFVNED